MYRADRSCPSYWSGSRFSRVYLLVGELPSKDWVKKSIFIPILYTVKLRPRGRCLEFTTLTARSLATMTWKPNWKHALAGTFFSVSDIHSGVKRTWKCGRHAEGPHRCKQLRGEAKWATRTQPMALLNVAATQGWRV